MSSNILEFDLERMERVKGQYDQWADKLESIISSMDDLKAELQNGWQTSAGDKFFEKYDDEWVDSFKLYADTFRHMSSCLETAIGQYDAVVIDAEALHIN